MKTANAVAAQVASSSPQITTNPLTADATNPQKNCVP